MFISEIFIQIIITMTYFVSGKHLDIFGDLFIEIKCCLYRDDLTQLFDCRIMLASMQSECEEKCISSC